MEKQLITVPKDYELISDEVMSNFDHKIDENIVERLKKENIQAQYAAWNFCGYVWYDKIKEEFYCNIWVHGSLINTLNSNDLEEIMWEACELYGDD